MNQLEAAKNYTAVNKIGNSIFICKAFLPLTILNSLLQEIKNYIQKNSKQFHHIKNNFIINKTNTEELHQYLNTPFSQFITRYRDTITQMYGKSVYDWTVSLMLKFNTNIDMSDDKELFYAFRIKLTEL
jgi:hypothetical protein